MGKHIQSSSLLINEGPLQVLPSLAVAIGRVKRERNPDAKREPNGLNEAIALQQLHYRLRGSKKVRDGRRWEFDDYASWQADHFPFWSERTVQRAFLELESLGLVITETYGGTDRRKWYTIDYERLNRLIEGPETVEPEPTHPLPADGLNTPTHFGAEAGVPDEGKLSDVPTWHDGTRQLGTMEHADLAPSTRQVGVMSKGPKTPPKNSPENPPPEARRSGDGRDRGGGGSKFDSDFRKAYALKHGLGSGWLNRSHSGEFDAGIELQLERERLGREATAVGVHGEPVRDTSLCPDCQGTGFWYPEGREKGAAKCSHPRLDEVRRREEREYEKAREEMAAR